MKTGIGNWKKGATACRWLISNVGRGMMMLMFIFTLLGRGKENALAMEKLGKGSIFDQVEVESDGAKAGDEVSAAADTKDLGLGGGAHRGLGIGVGVDEGLADRATPSPFNPPGKFRQVGDFTLLSLHDGEKIAVKFRVGVPSSIADARVRLLACWEEDAAAPLSDHRAFVEVEDLGRRSAANTWISKRHIGLSKKGLMVGSRYLVLLQGCHD